LPRDNSRTAVITLDEWFALLKGYFDTRQEAAECPERMISIYVGTTWAARSVR
jgi:hypothetical protein